MLGKTYAKFHLDVGIGDAEISEPDKLVGDHFLDFAGIDPAIALAIPKSQQFAEKIHAYTYPWGERLNTRTKDLVDLVLLIEREALDPEAMREALKKTFATRNTHPYPILLAKPPEQWERDFGEMARQASISTANVATAFAILEAYWNKNLVIQEQ